MTTAESYFGRSTESWTNFSQVSQHWRSSVFSTPALWTNVPLSYPRWAQEMLIGSKMAKLTIQSVLSFETSYPKTIKTVRSCLYEMNRVEEIDITTSEALMLVIYLSRASTSYIVYWKLFALPCIFNLWISSTTQNACNVLSWSTVRSIGTLGSWPASLAQLYEDKLFDYSSFACIASNACINRSPS